MEYDLIDGIRCYAKDLAYSVENYPVEHFERLYSLEENHFWFIARNKVIRHFLKKYLGNNAENKFLEIGCGTGVVLNSVRKHFDMQVTGAELSIQGLKVAKSRMPEVEFLQLDAREVPFKNSYDAIGLFDVLEHIDEDELVIKNMNGALKEGGLAFLSVPQHRWLWSAQDDFAQHKRRYERGDLITKLTNAGFEIIKATSFVSSLLPVMALSRLRIGRSTEDNGNIRDYHYDELDIPHWISRALAFPMGIDIALIKMGMSIPFGGSLFIVARKKKF